MTEKEEKYIELQHKIIDELDGLLAEARKIKHNVFKPQRQSKDCCPNVKNHGNHFKAAQKYYRQSAIEYDEELEKKEALLSMLNALETEKEKALTDLKKTEDELTARGQREWEQYRQEYFAEHPERKARYEAYLANGGTPVEW